MSAVAEIMSNRYTDSVMRVWKNGYDPIWARVNEAKLAEVARSLAPEEMKAPDWRFEGVYPTDARAFVRQTFFLNCINFAFTHFGGEYRKYQLPGSPLFVGAFACAAALTQGIRWLHAGRECDPAFKILAYTSSLKKTKRFFRGVNGIPMAGERRENLRHAAEVLIEKYDGDPWNILDEADWHAYEHDGKLGVVDLLVRDFGPVFDDRETLVLDSGETHELLFMKRGQLWPLMLYGRAVGSAGWELPLIRDAHKIGPVSDYSVPNGLRHLGILEYSPALTQAVDRRVEILAHSGPEVDIRTTTVVAMVEFVRAVNRERAALGMGPIVMAEGDYRVWRLGRKASFDHHLTRTIAY